MPQKVISPERELPEQIGWTALAIGAGWALARFIPELLSRLINPTLSNVTFLFIFVVVGLTVIGYAFILWAALSTKGMHLTKRNLILLLAGFFLGSFFVPFIGTMPEINPSSPLNWHIGYTLSGLVAGLSTFWVLRRSGLKLRMVNALTISTGFAFAFFVSSLLTDSILRAWDLNLFSSYGYLAMSAGSLAAGLFCGWILLAQIENDNGHEFKAL